MNRSGPSPSAQIACAFPTKRDLRAGLCRAIVIAVFAILPASIVSAANDKKPTPVEGVVEVLNDVLYQPYNKSFSGSIEGGAGFVSVPFDVPDHKRLIVEAVSFDAVHRPIETTTVNVNFNLRTVIDNTGTQVSTPLSVQERKLFGSGETTVQNSISTHSIKVRVDGRPGLTNELQIVMHRSPPGTAGGGNAGIFVNVIGYLVDIP